MSPRELSAVQSQFLSFPLSLLSTIKGSCSALHTSVFLEPLKRSHLLNCKNLQIILFCKIFIENMETTINQEVTSSSNESCKGCGKKYQSILGHLNHHRNVQHCKEKYTTDELITLLRNWNNSVALKKKKKRHEGKKCDKLVHESCKVCGNKYKSLLRHINHARNVYDCKEKYTLDELASLQR